MATCPSCGTENPDGSKFCRECATPLARPCPSQRRGAQGRHRALLRPGRVHRRFGVGRSRRRRPDALGLRRDGSDADRVTWRRGREVHRGCGRRDLRRTGGPRGRPRARGSRRTSDLRGRRGPRSDRRSTASSAGRDQHRGDPRSHRDHPGLGRTLARRGRDQHRLADPVRGTRDGRGGRVSPPTRPPRRCSTTRSWTPRRSRASPSRYGCSTRRTRSPGSAPTSPAPTTPRSSAARSTWRCCKGIFDKTVAADIPTARHRGRGARARQEPDRRRARRLHRHQTRPHHLAPGSVPALRRGHHVLGARGDREGPRRHLGVRRTRRRHHQARRRPSRGRGTSVVPPAAAPAARDRGDLLRRTRGAVHRVATVPRTRRRRGPHRARVRGPALGR